MVLVSCFILVTVFSGLVTGMAHSSTNDEPAVSALYYGTSMTVAAPYTSPSSAPTETAKWPKPSKGSYNRKGKGGKYDVKKGSDKYPDYGSGWNQKYNDCVQQCKANYGNFPPPTYKTYQPSPTYQPSATYQPYPGYGAGATHTVIVAPTQGVLRYVPFAVNASAGDTVKFMWGANNHTVTKSSALLPCNKSLEGTFATGTQNKDFVFNLQINDTEPIYFFCGTPTHCQKGMFAMINPPCKANASTSMGNMMPSIAANNSDIAAYSSYTSSQTNRSTSADNWGSNIDLGAIPEWSHPFVAENVLYTRRFLGSNAEIIKSDGSIDLSGIDKTPLMVPQDVKAVSASSTTSGSSGASSTLAVYQTPSDTASSMSTAIISSAALKSAGFVLSSSNTVTLLVGATIFKIALFFAV